MIDIVRNQQDLDKANRIGKHRKELGQAVDPIKYEGERGRFLMEFNGIEYVPSFELRDTSLAFSFDTGELEKILIKTK